MPLYVVKCSECGRMEEIVRSLSTYDDTPVCCGKRTERVIQAAFVPKEFQPYRSMANGQMIESREQHRQHLKAHKLVEVGTDKSVLEPRKADADHNVRPALEKAVHQVLHR